MGSPTFRSGSAAPTWLASSALVLALVLPACSSSDGGAARGPGTCAAGTVADATGACAPPGPSVCGAEERQDPEAGGACKALGWQACAPGFLADPSGHGCRDVLPAAECAPGTMPVLGQTSCQPVGPATCAAGFERDPSGWGCRAVLPSVACTGATRETLGSATCAPVGDCNAAFPPAGVTVVVNAAFTNAQVDATHVRTLAAGLAATSANGVIAVDAGTYVETIAPTTSVRIVGRCAAQVTLASSGADTAGITAKDGLAVTVEGMTVSGHLLGVVAGSKATLTLRDAVIADNRGGGVGVSGAGTHAIIERSVIRGTIAPTSSVQRGRGIDADVGADLALRDSTVSGNIEDGILIGDPGTHATVERSVVLSAKPNPAGDFGVGMITRDGATSETSASVFAHHHEAAVVVYGKGSRAKLTDVVVADTTGSPSSDTGYGLLVDGAAAELERISITGSRDAGIQVERKGSLTAHAMVVRGTVTAGATSTGYGLAVTTAGSATVGASAFVANAGAGAAASGANAKLTLDASLVAATVPDADGDRGLGIQVELGATADIRGSAVIGNSKAGVFANDPTTHAAITGTVIASTKAGQKKLYGRGVAVENGATVSLATSALIGNRDVSVSIRGAGTAVTFDEVVVRGTIPRESDGSHGRGVEADDGAKATLARVSLLENHGAGVVGASKSSIDLRDSWIADTLADGSPGGPGRAVTVQSEATMSLLGVVVERSTQIAMVATANASLTVRSSLVKDTTAAADGTFGHGLLASDGALLVVDDVTLTTCAGAALLFAGARGNVSHARITGNAVGIHVQDGSALTEVAVVPADPAEGAVNVSSDSTFDGNGSRVGSGALPLPAPLQ